MTDETKVLIRKPPANMIVPSRQRAEWDIILRELEQDATNHSVWQDHFGSVLTRLDEDAKLRRESEVVKLQMLRKIESATRWQFFRDMLIMMMLVATFVFVGYNTAHFWGWR